MADYTLGSVRSDLKLALGNRTEITDPQYNRWINEAVMEIVSELELGEMTSGYSFNTVASQSTYTLPTNVNVVTGVKLLDPGDTFYGGSPLRQRDISWYRQGDLQENVPTDWIVYGRQMILWRIPDAVYSISVDALLSSTTMTVDGDAIPLHPAEASLVLHRARWNANTILGQTEAAAIAQNDYVTRLRFRTDRLAKQQEGRSMQVSVPRNERDLRLVNRGYQDGVLKSS